MTLIETIKNDMIEAMKAKDVFRLGVIRMAKGAIQLEQINKKKELDDNDVIDIISKQIKLRKDAINEFKKANRLDLVNQNEKEIEVLNKYMPDQLTEEEIDKIINDIFDTVKPTSIKDLGIIMKTITPRLKGKADMSMVNIKIKKRLNEIEKWYKPRFLNIETRFLYE